MKKFYNSPVVEITVFDVEDIITASAAINTADLGKDQLETLANELNAVENSTTTVGAWNSTYAW